jgi:hypothetical protein
MYHNTTKARHGCGIMISVRLIKTKKESILTLCDSELLGKKFSSGGRVLDLCKYRSFYDGDLFDESNEANKEQLRNLASSSTLINAVGIRSVTLLNELGYGGHATKIGGVPHIQIYKM